MSQLFLSLSQSSYGGKVTLETLKTVSNYNMNNQIILLFISITHFESNDTSIKETKYNNKRNIRNS